MARLHDTLAAPNTTELHRKDSVPSDCSDGDLLERSLEGDASAASELVGRHEQMVRTVCRRLALSSHDADDAFQATFLVFVCKGDTVLPRANVGRWLHGVAIRSALKVRAAAARRLARERPVAEYQVNDDGNDSSPWEDLLPALHRVISTLPAVYREVIVACDLEGQTRNEVATRLGWPEGTVAGRLSRARAILARRMAPLSSA